MKKGIIIILIIFGILCSIGFAVADSSDNPNDVQTISKNGISIKFPADWGISRTTSNHSLVAISKLSSIDSNGVGQININIEKERIEGSFDSFVNKTYKSMEKLGEYKLSSSGEVAVGDLEGFEYTYTSNTTGSLKEHKAIWVEHNGDAYVILYSAPMDKFDENLKVFDYVVHNFEII